MLPTASYRSATDGHRMPWLAAGPHSEEPPLNAGSKDAAQGNKTEAGTQLDLNGKRAGHRQD